MFERKKTQKDLRADIAKIDSQLLQILHERKLCVEALSELKAKRKSPLRVPEVEAQVYKRNIRIGKRLSFREDFVTRLTKLLIQEALHWQKLYSYGRMHKILQKHKREKRF